MESWREELYHHGIRGQKWGVRRFQNQDGSLTLSGKKRYSSNDLSSEAAEKKAKRKETAKKIAKGVAIGAGVAAAGYGAYKVGNKLKNDKSAREKAMMDRINKSASQASVANTIKRLQSQTSTSNGSVAKPETLNDLAKMVGADKNPRIDSMTKFADANRKIASNRADLEKFVYSNLSPNSGQSSKKIGDISKTLDGLDEYTQHLLKRQRDYKF